jgi:hypothetical protein
MDLLSRNDIYLSLSQVDRGFPWRILVRPQVMMGPFNLIQQGKGKGKGERTE